ncbi:hypothetical protein QEH56_05930 [Pelagicoccus enzymogenes]|uniref:hypothetical protein n=1 Tax=Pelagicoccus enzymogenes TaxID=2773457 RepID=UPI00280F39B5|nr:hypothetical protein [Pelagicoccus enzymogenes]MDQ8197678.1 hypothetical protein [Pelagicoccus enzymogenes]
MKKYILLLPVVFLLSSCESYHWPRDHTGGFEEGRLSGQLWNVRMVAHTGKSWDYINDLCLLRCAEVCLDNNGYAFVLERVTHSKERDRGFVSARVTRPGAPPLPGDNLGKRSRMMKAVIMEVRMVLEGEPLPTTTDNIYDAQYVFTTVIRKRKLDEWDPIKYTGHMEK